MKGTVKWFDARKGYGFIAGEDGKDYFVYFSDIQMDGFKKLFTNQTVTFEAAEDEKGAKAVNVVPEAKQ